MTNWSVLSGLRFALALIVVLGHYTLLINNKDQGFFAIEIFEQMSAVYGFLVLSGYSIGASLERQAKGYYLRRIIRIYPLYICILIIACALLFIRSIQHFRWPVTNQLCFSSGFKLTIASFLMLQGIVCLPPP